MDRNQSITPYQLCGLCQTIAKIYTPSESWTGEGTHAFLQQHGISVEEGASVPDAVRKYIGKLPPSYSGMNSRLFSNDLFVFWATREPVEHHISRNDLRDSAERGCHLCSILVGSLGERNLSDPSSIKEGRLWISPFQVSTNSLWFGWGLYDHWPLMLHDEHPWKQSQSATVLAKIHVFRCAKDSKPAQMSSEEWKRRSAAIEQVSAESSRFRWSLKTGSDASIDLIDAWLRQCTNSHEACWKNFSSHVPSQLLDLDAGFDLGYIRLTLTSDIGPQPYVALSYAWGNSSTVLLTEDSLETFQARISVQSLPRTIRHAIKVCRMLRKRYLWVDALCIIQNSSEDFAKEVAQMGSIYASSLLTIAASDATSCDQGNFTDRKPLQVENCHIFDDGENVILFAGTEHDLAAHHLRESYLDTRAWVFQERTMSPRTIHFRGKEIIWECREDLTCQRCAAIPETSMETFHPSDRKSLFTEILNLTPEDPDLACFERIWSKILRHYTKSRLSNEDDRMSALGGIVQLLNNHAKYKSSFGLWHPLFLSQLLWSFKTYGNALKRMRMHISRRRKDKSGIPSWSWVSIHGEVVQLGGLSPKDIDCFSAELIQLPPATSFEQVSLLHRHLPSLVSTRLRSWVTISEAVPLYLFVTRELYHWDVIAVSRAQHCEISASCQLSWDRYLNHPWTRGQEQLKYRLENSLLKNDYWSDEEPIQSERLVCVLIKRTFSDEVWGPEMREYSLVLKCVDTRKNLYRRKGVYERETKHVEARHRDKLSRAHRLGNEDEIRKAHEEYDDYVEVLESRDGMRIRKLMVDRYSFFNEDEPKIEVEII